MKYIGNVIVWLRMLLHRSECDCIAQNVIAWLRMLLCGSVVFCRDYDLTLGLVTGIILNNSDSKLFRH